jgi:hypothetical protein
VQINAVSTVFTILVKRDLSGIVCIVLGDGHLSPGIFRSCQKDHVFGVLQGFVSVVIIHPGRVWLDVVAKQVLAVLLPVIKRKSLGAGSLRGVIGYRSLEESEHAAELIGPLSGGALQIDSFTFDKIHLILRYVIQLRSLSQKLRSRVRLIGKLLSQYQIAHSGSLTILDVANKDISDEVHKGKLVDILLFETKGIQHISLICTVPCLIEGFDSFNNIIEAGFGSSGTCLLFGGLNHYLIHASEILSGGNHPR